MNPLTADISPFKSENRTPPPSDAEDRRLFPSVPKARTEGCGIFRYEKAAVPERTATFIKKFDFPAF